MRRTFVATLLSACASAAIADAAPGFYLATGGTNLANMPLAAALVKAGPAGVALYPSGRATLEKAGTLNITGSNGPKTVQLAWIRGISPSPTPIWLDTDGHYFAEVGVISTMPAGYEQNMKAMNDFQDAETAKAVRDIAHGFLKPEAKAPVLFDHVELFTDDGRFVADQAVLARDGKIAKIGPAGSIKAPAGAKVIDSQGKTLVP